MEVYVKYDDSDVAKLLRTIISDPNKEEYIKLFTPFLCINAVACQHLFKIAVGNKLPKILDNGTICRIKVDDLGYHANKDYIKNSNLVDENNEVVVVVKKFNGFHDHYTYNIEYNNVLEDGTVIKDTTYAECNTLIEIDEF